MMIWGTLWNDEQMREIPDRLLNHWIEKEKKYKRAYGFWIIAILWAFYSIFEGMYDAQWLVFVFGIPYWYLRGLQFNKRELIREVAYAKKLAKKNIKDRVRREEQGTIDSLY